MKQSKIIDTLETYHTSIFGVKFFSSIQGFNSDNCGSETLVLRGTCTKTSRLLSTRSVRLRYGSGNNGASTAHSVAAMVIR